MNSVYHYTLWMNMEIFLLKFNERETLYHIHFRNPNPASTKLVASVNGEENFSFLINDIRGTKSLYGIV